MQKHFIKFYIALLSYFSYTAIHPRPQALIFSDLFKNYTIALKSSFSSISLPWFWCATGPFNVTIPTYIPVKPHIATPIVKWNWDDDCYNISRFSKKRTFWLKKKVVLKQCKQCLLVLRIKEVYQRYKKILSIYIFQSLRCISTSVSL